MTIWPVFARMPVISESELSKAMLSIAKPKYRTFNGKSFSNYQITTFSLSTDTNSLHS